MELSADSQRAGVAPSALASAAANEGDEQIRATGDDSGDGGDGDIHPGASLVGPMADGVDKINSIKPAGASGTESENERQGINPDADDLGFTRRTEAQGGPGADSEDGGAGDGVDREAVGEIAEPEPEATVENAEPCRLSESEMADNMAEPTVSLGKQTGSEMAEPFRQMADKIAEPEPEATVENAEPVADEDGDIEVDATGAFHQDQRLWNIGTYRDRHGTLRAKRVLRFVPNPPKPDIGIVTESLAAELDKRTGRGRWKRSREDAEELRRLAELAANAYWRDRRARRKGKALSKPKPKHAQGRTGKRGVLPETQADSQRSDVPDLSVKWPQYLD